MKEERFSEYRVMWIFVLFDLPTDTKKERKLAAQFRKDIMGDGFTMFQFSIYVRHCASMENAEVHMKRVRTFVPDTGKICMFTLTDKQFANVETFFGRKCRKPVKPSYVQLELF